MKRSLVPTYILAGLLCGAGVALLGSLLAFLTGVEGLTAAPGRFLFSTFLWSSFFVPVYPIALAVLLLSRRFSPRRFGVLNLLLLPFVTVSLFHKVALHGSVPPSFLPDLLVANLGRFPASVLLFALIVLELLLVLSLRRPPEPAGRGGTGGEKGAPAPAAPAARGTEAGSRRGQGGRWAPAQGPGGAEAGGGGPRGGRGAGGGRGPGSGARAGPGGSDRGRRPGGGGRGSPQSGSRPR